MRTYLILLIGIAFLLSSCDGNEGIKPKDKPPNEPNIEVEKLEATVEIAVPSTYTHETQLWKFMRFFFQENKEIFSCYFFLSLFKYNTENPLT